MTEKIRTAFCICAFYIMVVFIVTGTSVAETVEAEYTTQTDSQQGTFEEAIANVSDGGTVTLLADVTIDSPIIISKRVDINGGYNAFSINRGANNKGYMISVVSGVLTLENVIIDGGSKDGKEATTSMVLLNGGDLTLNRGVSVQNNTSTMLSGAGSGIAIKNGNLLVNAGAEIKNCDVPEGLGGGILLADKTASATIDGGTIENCEALQGGGVYIQDGTFNFNSGTIRNCIANYSYPISKVSPGGGGGIHVLNGTFNMKEGAAIDSCAATKTTGGGVCLVNPSSVFNMYGGTIQDCSSIAGGGLYVVLGAANISGGSFIGNDTSTPPYHNGGGAMFFVGGKADISNVFMSNNTSDSYGGCISFTSAINSSIVPIASLSNCVIKENKSKYGGAIGAVSGDITIQDTTITRNTATSICGGVFGAPGADIRLSKNVYIFDNITTSNAEYAQTYKDVYLDGNEGMYDDPNLTAHTKPMTITSALGEDSLIGISRWIIPDENNLYRIVAVPGKGHTITESDLDKFYSNDARFITVIHEGNIALTMRTLIKDLILTPEKLELIVGDRYELVVTTEPAYANEELEWTSSDENIAVVDSNGEVKAVAEGTAIITVKSKVTGLEDTCEVTVKRKPQDPAGPQDPDIPDEPDQPIGPEEPDTPEQSDNPMTPDEPDQSDNPSGPDDFILSDDETIEPTEQPEDIEVSYDNEQPEEATHTGDEMSIMAYLMIMTLSAIIAVACLFRRKEKI